MAVEAELSGRKKKILKAVVELYVKTAEPVGSKAIASALDNRVSSATIRNEMAELEEQGYLEKPHTSADVSYTHLSAPLWACPRKSIRL